MANVKNYTEQGGEKTVIGGTLEVTGTLDVKSGATMKGLPVAASVAASEATDVAGCVTSINAILTALKGAGLMEADAT